MPWTMQHSFDEYSFKKLYDIKQALVITGIMQSGSTWLTKGTH